MKGSIEFIKPNLPKVLAAFLLGILMIYIGITNFNVVKCSSNNCPQIEQPFLSKVILALSFWPALTLLDFSYVLFKESQNELFIFTAMILEFVYAYIIICLISYFTRRKN